MLFRVGKVHVSRAVLESDIAPSELIAAFGRYIRGDWGNQTGPAELRNDVALTTGEPIIASYASMSGLEFFITTEYGITRVMLFHEMKQWTPPAVS